MDLKWFNASVQFRIGKTPIKPYNLFNRRSSDGHFWGIGLLQIGARHLAYIGYDRAYLGFVRLW